MYAEQGKPAQSAVIKLFVDFLCYCNYVLVVTKRIAVLIENCLLALADDNRMQPHVRILGPKIKTVRFRSVIVAWILEAQLLPRVDHHHRVTVIQRVPVYGEYASRVDILVEAHMHLDLAAPHQIEHAELASEMLRRWP